jgi:hypothetical protein
LALFKKIRLKAGNYILRKKLKKTKRNKQMIGFEPAKTIGVLFKTLNRSEFEEIKKFLLHLTDSSKQVYALGFVDHKKIPDFYLLSKGMNYFSRKELSASFIPKSKAAEEFINKPIDILVDLSTDNNFPLYYISSLSKAHFKIGKMTDKRDCYDFMIDTRKTNTVAALIENIMHYTSVFTNA